MTAYSTLVAGRGTSGSLKSWIVNDNIPSDVILTEAQAWIWERLRVMGNMTSTTGTLGSATATIALSSRFRRPISFRFTGTNAADPTQKLLDFLHRHRTYQSDGSLAEGQPQVFAISDNVMLFEVAANKAYPWEFHYFQALPVLSTDTETNVLTERYPTLLRHACLIFANEWRKNEKEKAYYLQLAEKGIFDANWGFDDAMAGAELLAEVDGEDSYL